MNRFSAPMTIALSVFALGSGLWVLNQHTSNASPRPIFVSASPSPTQSASPSPTSSPSPGGQPSFKSNMDQVNNEAVLNYLHHLNMSEVTLANNVLHNLQTTQARNFAQSMITDHEKAEEQITKYAEKKSITLYPYQPSTYDVAVESQLDRFTGTDYDLAYLETQLVAHNTALQNLKMLSPHVTDSQVQNLVSQTINDIQKHISTIQSAIKEISSGSSGSSTPTSSPSPGSHNPSPASPSPSPTHSPGH